MRTIYVVLFLISAASLAFQVALTRFFALAQGSHLAFMAISLALLGIGASGAYLSLKQPAPSDLQRLVTVGSALFALTTPAAYLVINYLPFDAYRLTWERVQLLWLALYYLALTVPFFFSGLVIGAALSAQPERAGPTYAANLLGSGVGPPLALLALDSVGGPGTVFLCTLLGWLAVGSYQLSVISHQLSVTSGWPPKISRRSPITDHWSPITGHWSLITGHRFRRKSQIFLYFTIALALLYLTFYPPALFAARLTPYKSLSQALLHPDSEIVFQEWNAFSRVDVLRSSSIHSAPGLSFAYPGELPSQLGLMVDGDNLTPITRPTQPILSQYLPLALAFTLRSEANTLILEPGGGLALQIALDNGAKTVTVAQSNHTVAEAVGQRFADFNGNLYGNPQVRLLIDEPRSFLRRAGQQFDLILLPLTDSFHPVTAGAYTLNEDYRYTVESFVDALDHLSPNGLLVVERWLQLPPSESLRLWGAVIEALRQIDNPGQQGAATDPADHLMALRTLQTSLIVAGRAPLSRQDLAAARTFAQEKQFDLIWLPDIEPTEANRYSVVPEAVYYRTFAELLTTPDPVAFFATYPYAVAPPTDDHPYFFHFFKWGQTPEIIQTLGKTWQPFGGSGYLVLVVLLILVIILSAGLILLPLATVSSQRSALRSTSGLTLRYLAYFTLLGFGFLFVEIPLLQRFILYLGQPAYAFAVVVSALLVALSIGSRYLSERLPLRVVLPLIAVVALSYPLLLPHLFEATLRLPFAGRIVVTVATLLPLGVLMGVPFPRGLALVGRTAPQLTPWAWAINGCASVVCAVTAAMIALTWGFTVVLWSAALAYGLAGWVISEQT